MKKIWILALICLAFTACSAKGAELTESGAELVLVQFEEVPEGEEVAVITTNRGDITVRFFPELAPKTVENFVTHAKEGYFDGVIFHRVMNDFMIQGGDPQGDGYGGESIWGAPFEDEFSASLHNFRGALSMANSGANTNGSQFFIVQAGPDSETLSYYLNGIASFQEENPEVYNPLDPLAEEPIQFNELFLPEVLEKYKEVGGTLHLDYSNQIFGDAYGRPGGAHTVFGHVIEGMDVVDAIAAVEVDENDKPLQDVVIEKIEFIPYSK